MIKSNNPPVFSRLFEISTRELIGPTDFVRASNGAPSKAVANATIASPNSLNPSRTEVTNPVIKLPSIVPREVAIFSRTGSPLSRNFSKLGNFSISAPTATANAPIAPIKVVRAVNAVTPINANGPTIAILISILVRLFIRVIISMDFVIAFSILSILDKIPINTINGMAMLVKARTPASAANANDPIKVNGINRSVNSAISNPSIMAFSFALFKLSIADNALATTQSENAITVKAITPANAPPIFPANLLSMATETDMASSNIDKEIAAEMLLSIGKLER